jgi:hydroxymethylpyrimidine/phosphomethylpyrimidine kinase
MLGLAHSERNRAIPAALTIAGSDPSGGAGIQADLKTFAALRVYGFSAITSVIAQNSSRVDSVEPVSAAMVAAQIAAIAAQKRPGAVKTGALASAAIVQSVARTIRRLRLPAPVVDPVMISSSGKRLLEKAGEESIRSRLMPLARVITPNIPEAEALSGMRIDGIDSMRKAAIALREGGAHGVVIKGGHLEAGAPVIDLFYDGRRFVELESSRIEGGQDVHGTGCAFSAAIAAYLARGESLENSVRRAKAFITRALRRQLRIGKGRPMLDHLTAR